MGGKKKEGGVHCAICEESIHQSIHFIHSMGVRAFEPGILHAHLFSIIEMTFDSSCIASAALCCFACVAFGAPPFGGLRGLPKRLKAMGASSLLVVPTAAGACCWWGSPTGGLSRV